MHIVVEQKSHKSFQNRETMLYPVVWANRTQQHLFRNSPVSQIIVCRAQKRDLIIGKTAPFPCCRLATWYRDKNSSTFTASANSARLCRMKSDWCGADAAFTIIHTETWNFVKISSCTLQSSLKLDSFFYIFFSFSFFTHKRKYWLD